MDFLPGVRDRCYAPMWHLHDQVSPTPSAHQQPTLVGKTAFFGLSLSPTQHDQHAVIHPSTLPTTLPPTHPSMLEPSCQPCPAAGLLPVCEDLGTATLQTPHEASAETQSVTSQPAATAATAAGVWCAEHGAESEPMGQLACRYDAWMATRFVRESRSFCARRPSRLESAPWPLLALASRQSDDASIRACPSPHHRPTTVEHARGSAEILRTSGPQRPCMTSWRRVRCFFG